MDLLRTQLVGHDEARVPTLHLRAFEWYAEAGRTGDAIRHGVTAGAVGAACDLAAGSWAPRLDYGKARTTLSWLDALPAEAVAMDPRLLLAKAWASELTNWPEEALHAPGLPARSGSKEKSLGRKPADDGRGARRGMLPARRRRRDARRGAARHELKGG